MDHNIIGEQVKHKAFGLGVVEQCDGKRITVQFESEQKTFSYPEVFRKFMVFTDEKLAAEMLMEFVFEEKEEKEDRISALLASKIKTAKSAPKSSGRKTTFPFGSRPDIVANPVPGFVAVDEQGYQDWTDGSVHLSVEDWEKIITDIKVFTGDDFIFFGSLYACEDHTSTARLLASKQDKPQTAFNKPLFRLCSRALEKLKLPLMKEKTSWALMLLAIPNNDTIIWKMRPELVEALERCYPEYFHS